MSQIITSKILADCPEIIHGVSTKYSAFPAVGVATSSSGFSNNMSKHVGDDIEQVMKNRGEFYSALGIDINTAKFAHANQIHSGDVTAVNEGGLYPKTDALITNRKNLFLVISVADCLPVILYDKAKQVIAGIHSGWRGTVKGIAANTITKMKEEYGSNPNDIFAFIGPGISCENFEVGAEVAELFEEKYVDPHPQPLSQKERGVSSQKFFIDLKAVVRDQLIGAGVKLNYIDICSYCTFAEAGMLHSYRRDRDMSGRMFAVIGMR
jgi:YfiH family protein